MPRIRTIKPEFFKNEELCELPAMARLLFIGLWTQADREGKLEDRPKRLKAELFPYENYDVEKGLNELRNAGLIFRYKANANISDRILAPGQPNNQVGYILIPTFLKHQQPNIKEAKSVIPNPQINQVPYKHDTNTVQASQEGKGREQEMEQEREGNFEHDPDFENLILGFFGFNEIKHFQNFKKFRSACVCCDLRGEYDYFKIQCENYKIFTEMIGLRYKHTFDNFLGKQEIFYEDGVWNKENWELKISEEKEKSSGKKESNRGAIAVIEAFSQNMLIKKNR